MLNRLIPEIEKNVVESPIEGGGRPRQDYDNRKKRTPRRARRIAGASLFS
jgi:hypothetical protein